MNPLTTYRATSKSQKPSATPLVAAQPSASWMVSRTKVSRFDHKERRSSTEARHADDPVHPLGQQRGALLEVVHLSKAEGAAWDAARDGRGVRR